MLYLADRDGGTTPNEPAVAVIRTLQHADRRAGRRDPRRRGRPGSTTSRSPTTAPIYATQTGVGGQTPDPRRGRCGRSRRDGTASIFVQGAPLRQPNGIAFDPQGNIVVVNIGNDDVLTFSPDGKLVKTEKAAQAGNDGLVIMPDGTKYVSSVLNGGVSRIRPGQPAELIAQNIPSAGVDVLRRRREPAGDPDERQQRAGVHAAQVGVTLRAGRRAPASRPSPTSASATPDPLRCRPAS